MLKNELSILRIAHNIVVAFDYLSLIQQEAHVAELERIEREVCNMAQNERIKIDRDK